MRIFLNLYGGVSGDMLVAALHALAIDVGVDLAAADSLLKALPFEGVSYSFNSSMRQGIRGADFSVEVNEDQPHRHLSDVLKIISELPLSERARRWSVSAFEKLASAEARVHNTSVNEVHFHEVGAVDSIVDICLASLLIDLLEPQHIFASPIPVGSGFVDCDHGQMPVPAPATLELLRNIPTCGFDLEGERATPTGVALLLAWEVNFSERGAAIPKHFAYGVGDNDFSDRANFVRVVLEQPANESECVIEIRTMIDDQTGEVIGNALEQLRQQPVLEAYLLPVMAKQSRPGFEVVVICDLCQQESISKLMFKLLGTLGLRVTVLQRSTLARYQITSENIGRKLRFSSDSSEMVGEKLEFRDVVAQSEIRNLSPRQVFERVETNDGE
jgi:uncharacterized protein (TIGR00299 family) protein